MEHVSAERNRNGAVRQVAVWALLPALALPPQLWASAGAPEPVPASAETVQWTPVPPPVESARDVANAIDTTLQEALASQLSPQQAREVLPLAREIFALLASGQGAERTVTQAIPESMPATETSTPSALTCRAPLVELVLQYAGTRPDAVVRVVERVDGRSRTLAKGSVSPDDELSVRGPGGRDLAGEIQVFLDNALHARLDASCADRLDPGRMAGDFAIVDGLVRRSGALHPLAVRPLGVSQAVSLEVDADASLGVTAGDTLLYTVGIENGSSRRQRSLILQEAPGAHLRLVAGTVVTSQGEVTSGNGPGDSLLNVALGTLAPGATATVTFHALVGNPLPPSATRLASQGLVSGEGILGIPTDDPRTARVDDPTESVVGLGPAIEAALTAQSERAGIGRHLVHYTASLHNTGPAEAAGVAFTDHPEAPAELVVGSVQTTQGTVATGNNPGDAEVAVEVGALPPGGSAVVTFDALVERPGVQAVLIVSNQGHVTSEQTPSAPTDDPRTPSRDDPTVTVLSRTPLLQAVKTDFLVMDQDGDGRAGPGDRLRYLVNLNNIGKAATLQLGFIDEPDANARLVNGSVATSSGEVIVGNDSGDSGLFVVVEKPRKNRPVTVVFDVLVKDPVPAGTEHIANQGFLSSEGQPTIATDDPDTAVFGDPTLTPLPSTAPTGSTLGDHVWNDLDADGIQDAGEPGLADVPIHLLSADGSTVASTVSDSQGHYVFEDLSAGDYRVEFVAPAAFVFSPQDQGGDDARDSDAEPATGRTGLLSVPPGSEILNVDAGLYRPGALGDFVWVDGNADGIQDGNEPGLPGVLVSLLDASGGVLATTTTQGDGSYRFEGRAAGSYIVAFTPPAGFSFSPADQGGNDTLDSDANPATGRSPLVTLSAGASLFDVDAGMYQRASLGDRVWRDVNRDGVQDMGETGLEGVTVRLLDPAGAVLATTTTDAEGLYLFPGLIPAPHVVEFVPPAGHVFTLVDSGADDAADSDANPDTGRTAPVFVQSGVDDVTVDAGLFTPPTFILSSSPANGETDVAVTRETILRFSNPLAESTTIGDQTLFAEFGGQRLAARIHLAPDRRSVTLFYDQSLPASARIRVTLRGDSLIDVFGNAVDADRNDVPGGTGTVDFDTLTLTTITGTAVCGRVFASELAPGGGSINVPLEGVVVSVDGAEATLRAVSDSAGNFCLDPAPLGQFFVHIDGRTATNPIPLGDYYPFVGKLWESEAGRVINVGSIFLPRVVAGTLQPVSQTAPTAITFPPSVLAQFPELEGVQIIVPADSLYSDDGSRGGLVGIAPVPPDRLPGPPPPGLEFPLVITVQTDGASNFDVPVPACFPNLPDPGLGVPLPPGTKNALYSFNHDTGKWEHIGPMTVTADGRLICTDPGVGILAPGWHGSGPPPTGPPPPPGPPPPAGPPPPPPDDCPTRCAKKLAIDNRACEKTFAIESAALTAVYIAAMILCTFTANPVCHLSAFIMHKIALAAALAKFLSCKGTASDNYQFCLSGCPPPRPLNGPVFADVAEAGFSSAEAPPVPEDPVVVQIMGIADQIDTLLAPYVATGSIPPAVQEQVQDLVDQANAAAGGNAESYLGTYQLGQEADAEPLNSNSHASRGNAPPYPILYHAHITRTGGDELELRGSTGPYAQYALFVPRDGVVRHVAFYDPRTRSYGVAQARVTPGLPYRLPRAFLVPVDETFSDSDGDGLADAVEVVYGTSPSDPDSDNDGVTDGAEVEHGTNPLDGQPTITGVIATVDTPGTAVDVCAVNDMAAVADSAAGVAVMNVFNGMNPTIVAQVDTPGTAQAVACAGNRVVVADGTAGLAIIDITDPPAASIVQQLSLGGAVQAVTTAGSVAFAGLDSGRLVAIDLATGTVLADVTGLGPVHDMAVAGDVLFVGLNSQLRSYSIASANFLQFLGQVGVSHFPEGLTRRRRVFAGGGVAFVTAYPGYNSVDVHDPSAMVLTAPAVDSGPNSFKQIVANGSGLGIAAVGVNPRIDGTHDVWLYDVTNPAVTNAFLTVLPTPGLTRALSVYNGLAYVADSEAGLQVVNYLPYDANGVPPTIALSTNFAPGVAEEGQTIRLTAAVSDDVQVRNVQFFVNGARVLTDGNFPFEHRFVTPLISETPSFTIHACATDTGGQRTCTTEVTVTLTEDATPPQVTSVAPRNESRNREDFLRTLSATFSEPIDVATLGATSFQVFSVGPDGAPGTPDDVLIPGGALSYRDEINSAFLDFVNPLPIDRYRAVLSGTITDRKGNPLPAEYAWTFVVTGPNSWVNPAGGLWTDPANWSEGVVPGPGDIANIVLPGTYTVVLSGTGSVSTLNLGTPGGGQTLWVRGHGSAGTGHLVVGDGLVNLGTIRLESQVSNYESSLTVTSGELLNRGTLVVGEGTAGARNVTAFLRNQGTVQVDFSAAFAGTFTNESTVNIGANQILSLSGSQVFNQNAGSVAGPGTLQLNGATLNVNGGGLSGAPAFLGNSSLNLGPSTTDPAAFIMAGPSGQVTGTLQTAQSLWVRGQGSHGTGHVTATGFTNLGEIRVESIVSNYESNFTGDFTNGPTGVIDINVGTGGVRRLTGAVTNRGAINVNQPTIFTGTFNHDAGSLTVAAAQVFAVATGQVFSLRGGTIAGAGTVELGSATFNFNGGTTTGAPVFLGNSTLAIGAGATAPASFIMAGANGQVTGTLQNGQDLWVRGQGSHGTGLVTATGGFTNLGTIRIESVISNYESNLAGDFTNGPSGVIDINPGTGGARRLTGVVTNLGTVNVNQPANFTGAFNQDGGVLAVAIGQTFVVGGSQVFNLRGGTITGPGTVQLDTAATLNFTGGTTTGAPVFLSNATLDLGAGATAPASFVMAGVNGHVTGTLQNGQSLWVRGQGSHGTGLVTAAGTFTNLGNLRLESVISNYESNFAGDFTNGPSGVIDVNVGTGGARRITGVVTNQGAVNINQPTNFTGTLNHDAGMVTVAAGQFLLLGTSQTFNLRGGTIAGAGTVQVDGGTFNFDGGTTTGAPVSLPTSTLNIGAGATLPASFVMIGAGHMSGNIAAGQTVWVRGQGSHGTALLTAAGDFTNAGLLRLESQVSNYASQLAVPGGTLTNTGTVDIGLGTGGVRAIAANVANQGVFRVNAGIGVTVTGTQFDNLAGGVVEGRGTLTLSGSSLVNAGAIRPGASPGILSVGGAVSQAPAGAVDIEIGGLTADSQYDRLAASGAAALDGTLNLSLIDGFVPVLGATFDVLTCGSRTGTFATVNGLGIGGGLRFQVSYATNKVTVTVVPE
jgi:hypothetical protein